ncbi:peptide/nickel transport system substrate-binding protein [Streptomyces sp. 1222.5]|uniref:ABC transporter family substrate-binding protein n=1 Tax=unclassified Streptomyces TaxID=2593676 RepID=UPI00089D2061|nr:MULTISPECIES: ABC transporter family substrate-binding protein [unclassified Streptomyces]PKW09826.1 peptide/nickel transport system substrate-binding protein [Streptomyces sp. 5112.2]SEC23634.1 peptide/nickel transport system substrate-binding protein [Streptomyces sp. 1222.5]
MSHDGVGPRAVKRSVVFLTAGALAVPLLAGCGSDDEAASPAAPQDIALVARDKVADGGTLKWAVDAVPETLNTFQADADAGTARVAQAVLPSMFRLDANGRPVANPAYLESAKVIETEPRQVVQYKLNQQAVWSDGREIGAADFVAQWRALSGKNSAYWTARNAGYDRIEKIERGANDLQVRVTFSKPYADWRSLFSPLYPKNVMGTPDAFNDGARRKLQVTAGPFKVAKVDTAKKDVVLTRNARWWGKPAKLNEIVLHAVPRDQRAVALADGSVDLAEVDSVEAQRIGLAGREKGTGTPLQGSGKTSVKKLRSWALAHGFDSDEVKAGKKKLRKSIAEYLEEQQALAGFEVRKSLEPAYTQLALNGSTGPLLDDRVRRAVARALDRDELAKLVLTPLGLPAVPVGSHLALSGQPAYADNSGAIGGQDTKEAQALLADAGWVPGGPVTQPKKAEKAAGPEKKKQKGEESDGGEDGEYIVGEDDKGHDDDPDGKGKHHESAEGTHEQGEENGRHLDQEGKHGGAPGAYAPKGTAAPAAAPAAPLAKDGKPLLLRFVLPSGPGSESLNTVAGRISAMLERLGIRTEISRVPDESYFKDHIASGDFDLALYSWPASAFPATDARPIYAKPVAAADGSVNVEQNYTRVGTDQVNQLFDEAVATLDEDEERSLIRKADARIWAAAGSIPLYQRPQLMGARKTLVNAGAFGFQTPVYEDMGYLKKGAKVSPAPSAS